MELFGIYYILLSALFVAASNLCMRKSCDAGGTTKAFLVVQLFIVFLVAIVLNPVRSGNYSWSWNMALFGALGGLILGAMMASLGKALELGPPGLTFASLSSSTVIPSVLMVLLFGKAFNYSYTFFNGLGALIVVAGLFWAGAQTSQVSKKRLWLTLTGAAFILHVLFLSFLNWRALFINFPDSEGLYLSFDTESALNSWFMPAVFLVTASMQLAIYLFSERRWPKRREVFYGLLGGVANGVGTFFLIRASEVATEFEHALIYPIYAVVIMLACNLWGQILYQEKVNWKASGLCVLGILVGTLNWQGLINLR